MEFPKNEDIQRPWVKAVESTRKFLKGPSKHTVICSDHINADCFVQTYRIKPSFNLLAIKKSLGCRSCANDFSETGSKNDRKHLQERIPDFRK